MSGFWLAALACLRDRRKSREYWIFSSFFVRESLFDWRPLEGFDREIETEVTIRPDSLMATVVVVAIWNKFSTKYIFYKNIIQDKHEVNYKL